MASDPMRDPLNAELERLRAENVKLQAVEGSHGIALRTVSTLLDWGGVAGEDLGQRVARIIVERDELRTRLGEYERALTIGVIRDVGSRPRLCALKVAAMIGEEME